MESPVLQDKDSVPDPAQYTPGVIDVCVEKCSNHPGKVVEYFCDTCDVLGCNACIKFNHLQCKRVVYIPDIAKEPETSVVFSDFDQVLRILAWQLDQHKEKIAKDTVTNTVMKNVAKEELKIQRNEINKFFDDLEKKMDLEIELIEKNNNATLKAASEKLQLMEKKFREIETWNELKKNGQNCELFITIKKNKQKLETLNDQCDKLSDEWRIQRYVLLPSKQIEAMMKTTTEICRMTTAKFQTKIDTTSNNDFQNFPVILSLTTVHGHYCVASDRSNMSVKVIDTKRMCLTSEISINAMHMYGLTTVKNDLVALSVFLRNSKPQIQFFSMSTSGVIKSASMHLDVDYISHDLAYCNDKLFLCQTHQILVCNITGEEQKIIHFSVTVDDGMHGITLSPDGKTIYVTGYNKNTVTSMTLDGNVKAIYQNKNLKGPVNITVDKDGYVYVRTDAARIHQLTANLSGAQIIIDGVSVSSITISNTENKLYITEYKCISVYDLNTH